MLKALKEAKVHTSWITPNTEYEEAVLQFVRAVLDPADSSAFLDDFLQLQKKVAFFGIFNSLSQTVLKLGSPGVADIYQGNELWDFSLVDPDNRRPVDYALRNMHLRWILDHADDRLKLTQKLLDTRPDGRIKLQLTLSLLSLRRSLPELFTGGDYQPLSLHGPAAAHVVAFRRRVGNHSLIVAIGRLFCRLGATSAGGLHRPEAWRGTKLRLSVDPGTTSTDALVGRRIVVDRHSSLDLCRLFDPLPIAVLTASD